MARCSNCNAQVPDGTRFCDQCGRPLAAAPAPPAVRPARPASSANPNVSRAMPQPPLPSDMRPASDQPAPPGSGFKLPTLPSVAQSTGQDSVSTAGPGSWPGLPLMPTAPVPEVAIRPRATLAIAESQTPFVLSPDRDHFLIGREDPVEGVFPDVDLTLSGGIEAGVSRRHAKITYRDGGYWLEDLDSRNYTFVNRVRLEPNRPRSLRDGDEIEFGTLQARFYVG